MSTIRIGFVVPILQWQAGVYWNSVSNGLSQLVVEPTRGDAILDLIIAEFEGHVFYRSHLGTSNHITLIINLKL